MDPTNLRMGYEPYMRLMWFKPLGYGVTPPGAHSVLAAVSRLVLVARSASHVLYVRVRSYA